MVDTSGHSAPAICAFGDNILIAFRNPATNAIVAHEIGGATTVLPGQSTSEGPALAWFGGKLVMAYKGLTNDRVYLTTSSDGLAWSHEALRATHTTTRVALCAARDGLHLAYTDGASGQISTMTTRDGGTWSDPDPTSLAAVDGPALACRDGALVLVYQAPGPAQALGCAFRSEGAGWSPSTVPSQGTPLSPCVVANGTTLYSTYRGIESNHLYATSASLAAGGIVWNGYQRLDQESLASPSLARIGPDLFMAYTDPCGAIRVAVWADGWTWTTIATDVPADLMSVSA